MTEVGFAPGALVAARGRDWVVLPESTTDFLVVRPLNGDPELVTGLFPGEVQPARFSPPTAGAAEVGDHLAAGLLRTALRIGFTASAGPLRSIAAIAVEPRQYQLVPLLVALRMSPVRLLIGDDVGIGKTVEAGLIARELLDQGEARRLAVLCPPALAEQWQAELAEKFGLPATLVLPATINRLERDKPPHQSVFDRHQYTVVSTDFIKAERRRAQFAQSCPDLVIVDEAHTCVGGSRGRVRQLRHDLLTTLAADRDRHLVLVTATPHSGDEGAFRDLVGLLDPRLSQLDLDDPRGRTELARHFVQRRRRDIRRYLGQDTPFPQDRQIREVAYEQSAGYAELSRSILSYARESVRGADGVKQRVRWWSALALLRCVASSPRAAAATLRARSVTAAAESVAEADRLGLASVLDHAADDALEGMDAAPGADDESLPRAARDRLRDFAQRSDQLVGTEHDGKLRTLVAEVKALLADGYDPIIFCRYIPTADYITEQLGQELSNRVQVAGVNGTLPPPERIARIADLVARPGRHVLVATDCLSEGVNLQDHFQAVIHYDLAWNPTRHEQREGRVDRFGQRRNTVRAVTMYGLDNGIDGVVLDVLVRKHRTIARHTGVAVPVPDRSDQVMQALIEGILLRTDEPYQPALDLDLSRQRDTLHRDWESAADRESKLLTKYAWSGLNLDEVQAEVDAIRQALGSPTDVARFVREVLAGLGAPVRADPDGLRVPAHVLPPGVQHALGRPERDGPDPDNPGNGRRPTPALPEIRFRYDLPVPPGEHALVRTDPAVAALARYTLEAALDPQASSPARRCGVVRTGVVISRTVLLVVRYRFHLTLPGRQEVRHLVAEDAQLVAYQAGADGSRRWCDEPEAAALLTVTPDANVLPELVDRTLARTLAELDQVQLELDQHGQKLARRLREAHRRVRQAAGARHGGLTVVPGGPADVLGVYVYLPVGGGR